MPSRERKSWGNGGKLTEDGGGNKERALQCAVLCMDLGRFRVAVECCDEVDAN